MKLTESSGINKQDVPTLTQPKQWSNIVLVKLKQSCKTYSNISIWTKKYVFSNLLPGCLNNDAGT